MLSLTTFRLFCFYETPGNLHELTVIFRLQLLATTALPAQVPCLQDGVIWESWENAGKRKMSTLSATLSAQLEKAEFQLA